MFSVGWDPVKFHTSISPKNNACIICILSVNRRTARTNGVAVSRSAQLHHSGPRGGISRPVESGPVPRIPFGRSPALVHRELIEDCWRGARSAKALALPGDVRTIRADVPEVD